ncbi:MAG: AhpC/TSA family protein [Gammaproteobacteria bacterium]|nr:AhpC/TSA family protein [Gammaproteobacteria bacterium]
MAYTIDTLAPDFSATLVNGEAAQLTEMIKTQSVCVIFLRFLGCPLTRLRLAELEKEIEKYEINELKLIVVFESTVARTEKYMTRKGLTMDIIVDEQRKLYDLFDVQPGGLKTMLNPNMLKKAGEATIKGHMHGAFEGNELQLPAAFIINKEQKFSYVNYGEHPADAVATDSILLNMTA